MDGVCGRNGKQNHPYRQHIHRQSVAAERTEETGSDLKANSEYEQHQTELLYERKHYGINPETEMAKQDTHKEDPHAADGQTFDLEFTQEKS
jgi:hypothetical protein